MAEGTTTADKGHPAIQVASLSALAPEAPVHPDVAFMEDQVEIELARDVFCLVEWRWSQMKRSRQSTSSLCVRLFQLPMKDEEPTHVWDEALAHMLLERHRSELESNLGNRRSLWNLGFRGVYGHIYVFATVGFPPFGLIPDHLSPFFAGAKQATAHRLMTQYARIALRDLMHVPLYIAAGNGAFVDSAVKKMSEASANADDPDGKDSVETFIPYYSETREFFSDPMLALQSPRPCAISELRVRPDAQVDQELFLVSEEEAQQLHLRIFGHASVDYARLSEVIFGNTEFTCHWEDVVLLHRDTHIAGFVVTAPDGLWSAFFAEPLKSMYVVRRITEGRLFARAFTPSLTAADLRQSSKIHI